MDELDTILKHYGIKGMKWGKRNGTMRQKFKSLKREYGWRKVIKNMDNMSTKDIRDISRRISLENDLKLLSKSKIGKSKDKIDYLRRADMSESELSRKVDRLRAKDKLQKSVSDIPRAHITSGFKILQLFRLVKSI
jgi:hypothetical protein